MNITEAEKINFTSIEIYHSNLRVYKTDGKIRDFTYNMTVESSYNLDDKNNLIIELYFDLKSEELFELVIEGRSKFSVKHNINAKNINHFIDHGIAVIFPYLRSYISTITINSGAFFYPINIPLFQFKTDVNLKKVKKKLKRN